MQLGYSKKLGVATEEVLVGVYDFDAGAHSTERFSTSQINRARRNLRGLLALLKERFK
jgi:hypothetical protein